MPSARSPTRRRRRVLPRRCLPLLGASAIALSIAPSAASAAPAVSREIDVPGRPGALTLGPDGNVWVVLDGGDADVASITPDGTVTPYRNARLSFATGIATGPDARLWITRSGEVVRFDPRDPVATDTAFPVPGLAQSRRIVSDGRSLWTASGDRVFKLDTAGVATPTRIADMDARGLGIGGDGRIWIADSHGLDGRIAIVDPADPSRATFVETGGAPQQIVAGAGTQMGYTNPLANPQEVGRVTPPGAAARTLVPGTDPFGIAFGEDGAYWIANFGSHDLTRLAADGTVTTLGGLTPLSGPRTIARGLGGTLWIGLEVSRRVALVSGLEAPRPPAPPIQDPPAGGPPPTGGGSVPRDAPQPDRTRPTITQVTRRGRSTAGVRAINVSFVLSERATVTATLLQPRAGKRRDGRCVAPSRRLRRAPRCTRWVRIASVSGGRAAGRATVALRRTSGQKLAAGRYRVTIAARDAAGNSSTTTIAVRLLRR